MDAGADGLGRAGRIRSSQIIHQYRKVMVSDTMKMFLGACDVQKASGASEANVFEKRVVLATEVVFVKAVVLKVLLLARIAEELMLALYASWYSSKGCHTFCRVWCSKMRVRMVSADAWATDVSMVVCGIVSRL